MSPVMPMVLAIRVRSGHCTTGPHAGFLHLGAGDLRPAQPHFTALFRDAVFHVFPARHNPIDPLFLFWEEQKRDCHRQAIIDVSGGSRHSPVNNELCRVGAIKLTNSLQCFRVGPWYAAGAPSPIRTPRCNPDF